MKTISWFLTLTELAEMELKGSKEEMSQVLVNEETPKANGASVEVVDL